VDLAVHWTEYVIKYKGAPHMRSSVLDLYWYQDNLLDVIALLALGVVSVVLIAYIRFRVVLGKIWGGGTALNEDDKFPKKT
jgi:glucuronosyltransferase